MALTLSEPLTAHPVFAVRDLDSAVEIGARILGEHQLTAADRRNDVRATMNSARTRDARLTYLRYGVALQQQSADLDRFASVIVPLTGRMEVAFRGRTASATPTSPVVLAPGGTMRTSWSEDLSLLVLSVDSHCLREHFSALSPTLGDRELALDLELRGAPVGALIAQLGQLRRLIEDSPDPLRIPRRLEHAVLDGLLTTLFFAQPEEHLATALQADSTPRPRLVREATEYLESRLSQGVSIADAARHCGVGVRTLENAFKKHLSVTPQRFLRMVRLSSAHATLSQPFDGVTVTQVAMDCGFGHLGRFAAQYRDEFGELPAETLRRSRREGRTWRL